MDDSTQDTTVDYASVAAVLQRCGAVQSPAESQGFALGLLTAGVEQPLQAWQQELYSDFDPADVLAGECRQALDRVFASVFATRDDAVAPLMLLLPQDLVVDAQRLGAVRDWCQGFLFGFGLGGEAVASSLSQQSRDLLRDIAEFTRLDTDDVDNSAENQSALIEIEEYLRVGVMLVRDELSSTREPDESQ